ncbi:MAG TPA: DegT/DnrJ/EryC1/StrS family aminotransferase [Actinomycetota bacterium]|nr:DegT/DnrJ/EryC1/StrS family aminotransferase [Actinomycetota bacterium]
MTTRSELAIVGGTPVLPRGWTYPEWPVVEAADRDAIERTLSSGKLTCMASGEQEVSGLEREWAEFVGCRRAIGVANGTAALTLAFNAVGVEPGDEVLVPAVSFVASAMAVLHHMAVPVFVDVDPRTCNVDVAALEAAVTPRTTAIVAVHLHGLPCDMDEIVAVARRRGLRVVEDAAQAHAAEYRGRRAGTLGDIATFSLNVSKNLPTCGEGGLITTEDDAAADKCVALRQFGERLDDDRPRSYLSRHLGWNAKLNSVQAAFTRAQLDRFPRYEASRQDNVARFLARVRELPGLECPSAPPDRTHVWHILRFRCEPERAGIDVSPRAFRDALRRALAAEGVPASTYQRVPLPDQPVFRARVGFGRGYPWTLAPERGPDGEFPNATRALQQSFTIQKFHLNPHAGATLQRFADAFEKVFDNLDVVASMARAADARAAAVEVGG